MSDNERPWACEFSLELQRVPFVVRGWSGEMACEIVEMTGRERDQYIKALAKKAPDGKVKDYEAIQATLIVACCWTGCGDERRRLTVEEVQGWPARVLEAIHDKAADVNGLRQKAQTDAKND